MIQSQFKFNKRRSGFTFLEIMFVVVIIGILLALVGPKLVGKTQKAKIAATKAQLKNIEVGLKMFEMEIGTFPETLEDIMVAPSDYEEEWDGPYLDGDIVPTDSWKQKFDYKFPGQNNRKGFDLWSKGPDKQDKTEDDICNWTKRN
jgi:general secretion pathway protein G